MSELTFNLLRLGYLLLLWIFVLSTVAVLRRDISVRGHASHFKHGLPRPDDAYGPMAQPNPGPWVPPADALVIPQQPVMVSNPPLPGVTPGALAAPTAVAAELTGPPAGPAPIVVGPKPPKYLAITSGALAGSRLPLTSLPITIGRAPSNTLVIEDDYASSHHARIYPTAEGWVVEDLDSTNGTFIDGVQLTGAVLLPLETPVAIGHSTLKLVS